MASPRKVVFGLLFCIFAVLIQGCFSEADENHSVPEKVEHGEKGTLEYNVDTCKLTGSEHTKMDENGPQRPPWPPRPGRRNIIPIKARKAFPAIIRPGRSILDNLINKVKRKYQLKGPKILRPGRDDVPGREDVPQDYPSLDRPIRNVIPPYILRPGREDVPNAPPFLIRPGREDVPQLTLIRPGRNDIPDNQFHSVRAGRRSLGYNMPWTYEGSSVNSNVQHKSHTFRQKALEETRKRFLQDSQQEMSNPNSFLEEQQDF